MSSTVIGLLGVIGGALATGGIQTIVAFADRARGGRTSARLIQTTLRWAIWAISGALVEGQWAGGIDWEAFVTTWTNQQAGLAQALGTSDFLTVADAFTCITQVTTIQRHDVAEQKRLRADQIIGDDVVIFEDRLFELIPGYLNRLRTAERIVHLASFNNSERLQGAHEPGLREIERTWEEVEARIGEAIADRLPDDAPAS